MTKRALIAEPDPEEALRQAAILKDDGYETLVFSGADLVAELEANPHDLVILRHERPGAQTGLALVTRLKQVAPGAAIVITTSDLTPDAIEKNRKQKVHADGYLRLPVERSELVAAARAVPSTPPKPAPGSGQSQEGAPILDDGTGDHRAPGADGERKRPPPLPAAGLRALSPLAKAGPRGGGGEAVLTTEDLTFVEKVFSTIQHIDADAPVQEPPPSAIGDAGDRKVALLRSELKRRERELAKLSRLWKAREEDLRQKESRVQAKDIELEGLRLRIAEVTGELERANQTLVERESEFGRAMGETYDQTALEQAEYIQQVAAKENELNALKTKFRKAEDAWNAEKKEFTERVFEWEKAYADMEAHHWKVVDASVEEMHRLEAQVLSREADRKARDGVIRARELEVMSLNERIARLEDARRDVDIAAARGEEEMIARAHGMLVQERLATTTAVDEGHELRARLLDVEEDLARHQQLLWKLEKTRRVELVRMASTIRLGDAERARLLGERSLWKDKAEELEQALSMTRALGEATANQLFTLEEKRRIVGEVQIKVRDAKIADLSEESARLQSSLNDVTERLGQSEMEHATEQARAEDLDRALAETRQQAEDTEQRLARDLEVTTAERDKLADNLQRTEQILSTTKVDLAETKQSRQQREVEVAGILEKKDNELATKAERLQDLERAISDAKEDIGNLRKTITLRDERITELLNRVRQSDEQQVALEGKVFRLETANSEKEADLVTRDERIAQLALKLSQRDDELEVTEETLRKTEQVAGDKAAHIERLDANIASLNAEIARGREESARLQGELNTRGGELFEMERKASTLQAELQNARAEIGAGNAVVEQQQAQLKASHAQSQELRRTLEDTDGKLRGALVDLDQSGTRAEQMRIELAGLKELAATQERDLQQARGNISDLERARDQLMGTAKNLQSRLNETEAERHSLEESLAVQARENAELHATLSDATVRLEELQQRAAQLENEVHQREGRIHAQEQVLQRAETQNAQQQTEIANLREELAESKHAVDEGKSAIDERAKWLQTREAAIAELKTALDGEKGVRETTQAQLAQLQQQAAALGKNHEQLKARLEERERLLAATQQHGEQKIEAESARADSATREGKQLRASLDAANQELVGLRAEAQRAAELRIAEEKARSDAAKLRTFAERAANEVKTTRALLEKADTARKQAEGDAASMRAQIDDIRNAQKQGEQIVAQARLEGEQRLARLSELTQQVQRLNAARDASERARADAEQELARTKLRAEQELASGKGQLADEVTRLQIELTAAKKSRADALAAAQQSKAEAEQIKRLAAEKIKQAQAAARGSVAPTAARPATSPPGSSPPAAASMPPRTVSGTLAPPVSTVPAPTRDPPAPPASVGGGLAPPAGAPVTNPGFQMAPPTEMPGIAGLPSLPSMPGGQDPYPDQKTVVIDKPVIPSAARGDKN